MYIYTSCVVNNFIRIPNSLMCVSQCMLYHNIYVWYLNCGDGVRCRGCHITSYNHEFLPPPILSPPTLSLPLSLSLCLSQEMLVRLYTEGPETRGIFRITANYRKVKELKESINGSE